MRYEDIIEEAKNLRKAQKITLAEVGQAMAIDSSYISRIETKKIMPTASTLIEYLSAINLSLSLDASTVLLHRGALSVRINNNVDTNN